MTTVRLGLIGDNIAASRAPLLHRLAGGLAGLDVTYDLLIPARLGLSFDAVLARCEREGYRGLNITYPYKEQVVPRLTVGDPDIRAIGACNTVLFGSGEARGDNTDFTGFVDAFRHSFGTAAPGVVAMAGAGGVGKAIAFGLARLGASELRLYDRDAEKAEALAASLAGSAMKVVVGPSMEEAAGAADGLVNATPFGMEGIGGTAIPAPLVAGRRWAFDAVYTPVETPFVADARAAGLAVMSGYELFFFQGVNAFRIFTGHEPDQQRLRAALLSAGPAGG